MKLTDTPLICSPAVACVQPIAGVIEEKIDHAAMADAAQLLARLNRSMDKMIVWEKQETESRLHRWIARNENK